MQAMKNNGSHNVILDRYHVEQPRYDDFAMSAAELIRRILTQLGVVFHSVTGRAKQERSLAGKLQKPGNEYQELEDVMDLAALRIITYFNADVDKVADVIETEFDIIDEHSHDRRASMDPDRFGYVSVHYVASMNARRLGFPEYQRFEGLKIEIQIRSVLQHAWAEIEHDLGYKTKQATPREMRRRFARLAGLLELADDEFSSLRNDLQRYRESIPALVETSPQSVELNKDTLAELIRTSLVKNLDQRIADGSGYALVNERKALDRYLNRLAYVDIATVEMLKSQLSNHADKIVDFALHFLRSSPKKSSSGILPAGISTFYLSYLLVAQRGGVEVDSFASKIGGDAKLKDRIATSYEETKSM
ncbi:GTP pyrophosphokinase [Cupriavidus basilensis]